MRRSVSLGNSDIHWLQHSLLLFTVLISSCFRNTVYNICGSKQLWGNDGNVFNFSKFQEHSEQEAEVEAQCTGACYWDVCGYDIIYQWVRLSRKVKDRVASSSETWKPDHVVSLLPSWALLAQERLILLCFRLHLFVSYLWNLFQRQDDKPCCQPVLFPWVGI